MYWTQLNETTWTAKKHRIRISKITRGENSAYRLYDSRDWSGYCPGASPTWIGQEWHRTLADAQHEALHMLQCIHNHEHGHEDFDRLVGNAKTPPSCIL